MSKLKTSALAFYASFLAIRGRKCAAQPIHPIAPILLIGFLTIAPYAFNFWWKFLPSIVFVILLIRFKNPKYLSILGLQMSRMQGVIASCVFVTTVAVAHFLVPPLLMKEAIFVYKGDHWHTGWALMPFSQALLEELVLPNQGVKPLAQFAQQIAGGYKPF